MAFMLALLLLGMAGASYWLAQRIDRELPARFQQIASRMSYGLYDFSVGRVLSYPLGRRIILKNADLHVNARQLQALRLTDSVPDRLVHIRIARIEISGISWEAFLKGKAIRVADVTLKGIQVELHTGTGRIPLRLDPAENKLAVSGTFVDHFEATDIRFAIRHHSATHPVFTYSGNGSVRGDKILWDSRKTVPAYQDFQAAFGRTAVFLPQKGRWFQVDGWQLDGIQKRLRLLDFQYIDSLLPEQKGVQHRFRIPVADLMGLSRRLVNNELLFGLRKVLFFKPQVTATLPDDRRDTTLLKIRKFPVAMLEDVNLPLHIDTIQLQRGTVSYTEDGFRTRLPAEILFDELSGTLKNIYLYRPDSPLVQPPLKIQLQGHFQHQTPVNIAAELTSGPQQAFHILAKMGNMDGNQIRTLARHLGLIQMDKLQMQEARFDISGNTEMVRTQALIRYQDLRIQLLRYDSATRTLGRKPMASLLANKLLLFPSNPLPGSPLRTAVSRLPRPENRTFLTALWRGLFDAINQTVIADPVLMEYVKQREATRQERLKNRLRLREERLQRRQERRSGEKTTF